MKSKLLSIILCLTLLAAFFNTFAVSIQAADFYAITVAEVVGGSADVATNVETAEAESIVTVSISDICDNHQFKSLTVSGTSGDPVDTDEVESGSTYTFSMPSDNVTVTLELELIPISVYVQYGSSGTPSLVKTYTQEDLEALSLADPQYYTGIDSMPAPVQGKAVGVLLSTLIEDLQDYNPCVAFNADSTLKLYAVDTYDPATGSGSPYATYTYDYLLGATRYYYPEFTSMTGSLEGGIAIEPMLSVTSYQARYLSRTTLDTKTLNSLESYRFCFGMLPTAVDNSSSPIITANKFAKWVNRIDFVVPTYDISIDNLITGGTVIADKSSAAAEDTVTLTVNPDSDMQLKTDSLTVSYNDGAADQTAALTEENSYTYTFTMPAYPVTITAEFESTAVTYTVTTSVPNGHGTATAIPATVSSGESSIISLIPDSGYFLSSITDNDIDVFNLVSDNTTYIISNITQNHAVVAAFAEYISGPLNTALTLTSSLNPAVKGKSVTFTAAVSAVTGSGIPGGTVIFNDGETVLGSGALDATGQTTFTSAILAAGTHAISAVYSGDAIFAASSGSLSQVIKAKSSGGGGGGGGSSNSTTATSTSAAVVTATPSSTPVSTPIEGTINLGSNIDSTGKFLIEVTAASGDDIARVSITDGTTGLQADKTPLKEITVVQVTEENPDLPANFAVGSQLYNFGPTEATFDKPVTITINYDPNLLPDGVDESELAISWYDEANKVWVKLVSTVDILNHTITAQVSHFTLFAILAQTVSIPTATVSTPTVTVQPALTSIQPTPNLVDNSDNETNSTSSGENQGSPWLLIIAIAVVLGGLITVLIVKRKK